MRVVVLAVGKLKAAPEQELAEEYLLRAAKLGRKHEHGGGQRKCRSTA